MSCFSRRSSYSQPLQIYLLGKLIILPHKFFSDLFICLPRPLLWFTKPLQSRCAVLFLLQAILKRNHYGFLAKQLFTCRCFPMQLFPFFLDSEGLWASRLELSGVIRTILWSPISFSKLVSFGFTEPLTSHTKLSWLFYAEPCPARGHSLGTQTVGLLW